ncbi:hypothetical protein OIV83_002723 [Microbotryomycetes sp. JL201]|nr:hypothetical protein OIV83_002723 [Microbotryomycetes sp. JL201]
MANWAGIGASLQAILRPRILQPTLKVPSIASLRFDALKQRGITGIVIDKDNCITRPLVDDLDPSLHNAWHDLVATFGPENVLVVSNSAGTLAKDSMLLQAESVSRNLRVPVLVHKTPKPGKACATAVINHFSPSSARGYKPSQVVWSARARAGTGSPHENLPRPTPEPNPRLLVVGDRVTTDMVLAHRIASLRKDDSQIRTVSVLTTKLLAREGLGTMLMRWLEKAAVTLYERRHRTRTRDKEDWTDCIFVESKSSWR